MESLLALFAPMILIGIIFVIVFAIQDRKQAQKK
jgi:preprotein translocase subunit YajC